MASLVTTPVLGTTPRPSFAAMVVRSQQQVDFHVAAKFSSRDGIPSVTFDGTDLARAANVLRFALVMKFAPTHRPSVDIIRHQVNSTWGLKKKVSVSILHTRHVLLNFTEEDDMIKALSRESLRIEGAYFKIFRWTPEFNPKQDASLAPIWIQLQNLPVHLYPPPFLKQIVAPFGDYLRADNPTLTKSNTQRARVCIMVDLLKPLPEAIYVNSTKTKNILQEITYEDIPLFCKHCLLQGHEEAICRKLVPKQNKKAPLVEEHRQHWHEKNAGKTVANTTNKDEIVQIHEENNIEETNLGEERGELQEIGSEDEAACHLLDQTPKNNEEILMEKEVGSLVMRENMVAETTPIHSVNSFEALNGEEEENDEGGGEIGSNSERDDCKVNNAEIFCDEIVPETPENVIPPQEKHQEIEHGDVIEEQVDNGLQHLAMLEQVEAIVNEREMEEQTDHCLLDKEKDYILLSPQQVQVDREAALILARMEVTRLEKMVAEPKQKRIGKKNKKFAEATNASPTF